MSTNSNLPPAEHIQRFAITLEDVQNLFISRLNTLRSLLFEASANNPDDLKALLNSRIIKDMHPLKIQILYCCNQPYQFYRWLEGESLDIIPDEIKIWDDSNRVISGVNNWLESLTVDEKRAQKSYRVVDVPIDKGDVLSLSANEYLQDFLIPNFYFHLVTSYNILRKQGVDLGKRDYMQHLL